MLAKTPEFTADATLTYEGELASGNPINVILQFIRRGEFMQRVSNNPFVDTVPEYQIFNLTVGVAAPPPLIPGVPTRSIELNEYSSLYRLSLENDKLPPTIEE